MLVALYIVVFLAMLTVDSYPQKSNEFPKGPSSLLYTSPDIIPPSNPSSPLHNDAKAVKIMTKPMRPLGARIPSNPPSAFQAYDVCPKPIPNVRPLTRLACCLLTRQDNTRSLCNWILEWYMWKSCKTNEIVCCENIIDSGGNGEFSIGVGVGCVQAIGEPDFLPPLEQQRIPTKQQNFCPKIH